MEQKACLKAEEIGILMLTPPSLVRVVYALVLLEGAWLCNAWVTVPENARHAIDGTTQRGRDLHPVGLVLTKESRLGDDGVYGVNVLEV